MRTVKVPEMRRSLATALVFLFMTFPAIAEKEGPQATDTSKPTDQAQLLTTGRIAKIDLKKRVLTVRNSAEGEGSNPDGNPDGLGRRRPGIGFPGGVGFPRGPGRPPLPQAAHGMEFKVFITDKTDIKNGKDQFSFSSLIVGDHIAIQGLPKGNGADLEATQISLTTPR